MQRFPPETAAPELFRLIAEYTYDWETWVDGEGVPRWVNAAVERITGYSVQECLELPNYPQPMVHESDRGLLGSVLEDAARGGSGNDVEFRVLRKDGQERWVAISWQSVRSADGTSNGYRTSVRDIDERKRMEHELRVMRQRAEAAVVARSELLANVSHELRSPAHCIAGFSELLRLHPLEPKQARYVELIQEQCTAMLRQVEDLLQFAALEAGGVRLERQPVDVAALVRGLMEAATPDAQARDLQLHADYHVTQPWLEVDGTRLLQVFRNLVDNAIKFTDEGLVNVRLSVAPAQGELWQLRFVVEDTGIGMRPEETRRLLAPFQQADGATTRRHGGVGLGLAIAQRLVRQMNGQLEIQSALGEGTRITITLLLPSASPLSRNVENAELARAQGVGRALVVDDSAPSRELLRAMIEHAGWEVWEAENADSARVIAAREPLDLIFLDYQMPGQDGAEAAGALRKLCNTREPERQVSIYLLTANLFAHEQLGELAAIDGILSKPLSRAALLQLLARQEAGSAREETARAGEEPTLQHLAPDVIADLRAFTGRDGRSMLARVASQVKEDQERELGVLASAIRAGDWPRVAVAAHAIAGHAAIVGAQRAADAARALQRSAEEGQLSREAAQAALAALKESWELAEGELSELGAR